MKSDKIKLIVCDIEGCVMPADRALINPQRFAPLADYCKRARENPKLPPFVFCTGRQLPYAEALAQIIGNFFPGFPSIAENGAFLYDIAKNEIYRNPIVTDDVMNDLFLVKKAVENLVLKNKVKKEPGKEICISLNPVSDQSIENLFEEICGLLSSFSNVIEITHSKSAVDITPIGVNKAAGINFLAEFTGIKAAEMLGIGDTRGDLPMLKLVGYPTAPQNAAAEVKEVVSFTSNHSEIEGVVNILDRFITV